MQRVIDGKRYNTETATLVCGIDTGESRSDFRWEDTALYVTTRGAWFLAGEGHALSRWARAIPGGGSGPGEGIEPVDANHARGLLERHGRPSDIEKYFGDEITDA
jgi:hypothetical protein